MHFNISVIHRRVLLLLLFAIAACSSCADLIDDTMYSNGKSGIAPESAVDSTGIWDESRWDTAKWGE